MESRDRTRGVKYAKIVTSDAFKWSALKSTLYAGFSPATVRPFTFARTGSPMDDAIGAGTRETREVTGTNCARDSNGGLVSWV